MKRSFHSRLTRMLREAYAACNEAAALGIPIDEVTDLRRECSGQRSRTRREFLRGSGSESSSSVRAPIPVVGYLPESMARVAGPAFHGTNPCFVAKLPVAAPATLTVSHGDKHLWAIRR